MGSKLKPGNLGTTPAINDPAFVNSMAAAIESELNTLMVADGIAALSMDSDDRSVRDRRRLFVAIARGVVGHLAANDDAFQIKTTGISGATTKLIKIDTE